MASIRNAAVAGTFYPGDARGLISEVDDLLGGVEPAPRLGFPKALVVPHAGYIYSGPVAAHAYDELAAARGLVKRVVLLGPVHRVPVRGLAIPTDTAFATDIDHEEACGATPLNGFLDLARRRSLTVKLLSACNSGDTAGGKGQVVGYSSFALYEPSNDASPADAGRTLLALARSAIE